MIDVHTHLHPPRLASAIRRWFARNSDWEIGHQPTEPEAVATVLRDAGVERFVFCSYAHTTAMARDLNAWLAQTSRDLGGYGVPLATVHPDDPDYIADLRAALDDGCIGLKLHEDVQRVAVDDPRLEPVFAELEARAAFALVHVGPIPWAYPRDAGAERVARVCARHPDLRIVVAHYGVPDTHRFFALMKRHAGLYLDTTMAIALDAPMQADPVRARDLAAHAERIVYGTDYPNIPFPYMTERDALERFGLDDAALAAIVHGNAAGLIAREASARAAAKRVG